MNKRRYLFTTCPGGNPGNEARVYAAIQNLYVDTYLQVLKRVFCLLHAPGVNSEVSGPCELFPWTSGTAELELKGANHQDSLHVLSAAMFFKWCSQDAEVSTVCKRCATCTACEVRFARGVWGHVPQENFQLLRLFLRPFQTYTYYS